MRDGRCPPRKPRRPRPGDTAMTSFDVELGVVLRDDLVGVARMDGQPVVTSAVVGIPPDLTSRCVVDGRLARVYAGWVDCLRPRRVTALTRKISPTGFRSIPNGQDFPGFRAFPQATALHVPAISTAAVAMRNRKEWCVSRSIGQRSPVQLFPGRAGTITTHSDQSPSKG